MLYITRRLFRFYSPIQTLPPIIFGLLVVCSPSAFAFPILPDRIIIEIPKKIIEAAQPKPEIKPVEKTETSPAVITETPSVEITETPPAEIEIEEPKTVFSPTPYQAIYSAKYSGIPIDVSRTLKKVSDSQFRLDFKASALISKIDESSDFSVNDTGAIIPSNYYYSRKGLGKKKKEFATFDWEKKAGHYKDKKRKRNVDLVDGVLDKMTVYLKLRQDLKAEKTEMNYRVFDRGKIRPFNYKVINYETINTKLGPVETVKVARVRDDKSRNTTLWYSTQWNYVMVQLEQIEDGSEYRMGIKSLNLDGKGI